MKVNLLRGFVAFNDPDDLVVEADRRFPGICLKNSLHGIQVPDMMKRQKGSFCKLVIPVSVEIDHKGCVCIAESHRLERSIMVLTINRDYTLAKPALSPTMTKQVADVNVDAREDLVAS
jgi:hypothetical protein